ncbi:MAG: caspase family protein [Synechococcaceae cyanobacterium SM2_3_1]|nr:caspase family protein [Synechococcaceae cyanobacterium SM2_3_1]
MSTDRRTFLQRLLATAAGVGLSPGWLIRYGENYGGALAAMSRKRALLIGINTYPEPNSAFSLQGCLTDIELQRQLLLHRFGFAATDILTLTDQEATVTRLNAALDEMVSQLDDEDPLLIHFSGLGLLQPDAAEGEGTSLRSPALVLLEEGGQACSHLPLGTLFQTLAALSTSQLTLILDCGFNFVEPRVRGNLHLRSCPTAISQVVSAQDNPSPTSQLPALPRGLLLTATSAEELAAEATWSGFVAGIVTYLLTQYLWETTPATKVLTAFNHVTTQRELASLACQQPILQGNDLQSRQLAPELHTALEPGTRGWTGVIQEVKGNRASLWLGGVPPGVLCGLQNGTVLRVFPQDPGQGDVGKMVLRARNGLTAQATLVSEEKIPAVGTGIYERERALSLNMRVLVGMDDSLGRIEKVDITNALAAMPWAEAVYPQDQRVDCLLGKLSTAGNASGEGYGLFWPGRELIAGSWGPLEKRPRQPYNG